MWHNKSVSVVLATYREKNSIRQVIESFLATGLVDELVVVSNNAEAGTEEEVKKTSARLVQETQQGYGFAFRRGIKEAKGDYIVLCEPDDTFIAKDIERFLAKAENFQAVLGSRTRGATAMNSLRRFGNVVAAKTIQILFSTNALSDVGCTYKLFHKEALQKLAPYFTRIDPLFATELVLLVAARRIPFAETPITFQQRVGASAITPHWHKWFGLGIKVFLYIWKFWFQIRFKDKRL